MTADDSPPTVTKTTSSSVPAENTKTIFWQPCLEFQRPHSKPIHQPTDISPFVYPHPKHSSPTIVGMAVKRTLKSPDTPTAHKVDKLMGTNPRAGNNRANSEQQDCLIEITDSRVQCNNNNSEYHNNNINSLHYNTSTTGEPVISADTTDEHPLHNLFLRKLREKDAAFISERMHRDFFEETIRLISSGGVGQVAPQSFGEQPSDGVDTFRSTKQPDPTATTTTTTTPPAATTTQTLASTKTSYNSPPEEQQTSESKINTVDAGVRSTSGGFSSARSATVASIVKNDHKYDSTYRHDTRHIGDNGMPYENNHKELGPDLHTHSTADTVDATHGTHRSTTWTPLRGDTIAAACVRCAQVSDRAFGVRLHELHWDASADDDIPTPTSMRVNGGESVQCVRPNGSPFIVVKPTATIPTSSTPNTCSVITDSTIANPACSNPTLLDKSAVTAILCETCALALRGYRTSATVISEITPTTPRSSDPLCVTATCATTHPSIRPNVHDVTTASVSQAHEPRNQTQQQPIVSSCTSVATSLYPAPAVVSVVSSSTWSSTQQQQQPSRTPSASGAGDSSKWAENLLAKLRQEHHEQRLKLTISDSNRIDPSAHSHHNWPGPVDLEHNLNNNNITKSNNNSLAHISFSTPTPSSAAAAVSHSPSQCVQENGCQRDDNDGHDADAAAKIRCHRNQLPDVNDITTDGLEVNPKCCEHYNNPHRERLRDTFHPNNNNHNKDNHSSSAPSINFSSALKQIEAIYGQTDISDVDDEVDVELLVEITPEKHCPDSPSSDSFEASNRLRRLENRFRDLAFTKKLLLASPTESTTTTGAPAPTSVAADSIVTTTTTNTTTCPASSEQHQFGEGGETTPNSTSENPSHSRAHHWRYYCESSATASDATRVRSAIDSPTSSYCCSSTAIELDPSDDDNVSPTTHNSIRVADATSSAHLLRLECKHNHQQSRESDHGEHHSAPDHHDTENGLPQTHHQGQVHHQRRVEKEEDAHPVGGGDGECDWSRLSTSKPADAGPTLCVHHRSSSSASISSENPDQLLLNDDAESDEFIEPDLIRFDDAPISSATVHLKAVNNHALSSSLSDSNPFTDDSESDELSHIFLDNNTVNQPQQQQQHPSRQTPPNQSPSPPPLPPHKSLTTLLNGDLHTHCEFDVRHLGEYSPQIGRVFECYDELIDSSSDTSDDTSSQAAEEEDDTPSDHSDSNQSCDCSLEAIPLQLITFDDQPPPTTTSTPLTSPTSHAAKMRDAGPLRGLLKKPNRPPPTHKNRVVFDETQNKFFDADYIILIREDCQYDEEDDEPCTCGDEHKFVRLCCEEGCQCMEYGGNGGAPLETTADNQRTPQSPKFAPPIEFVDPAALSPPEGYKDGSGGKLTNALGGALGGHVFGAQHMQQLQVIQRLQAQRAAMLAARATNGQPAAAGTATTTGSGGSTLAGQPQSTATGGNAAVTTGQSGAMQQGNNGSLQQQQQQQLMMMDPSNVCTECAECAECAAKQSQQANNDCTSPCSDDEPKLDNVPLVALAPLPMPITSPERRIIAQKEIIAGEERPKYLFINNQQQPQQQEVPVPPPKHAALKAPIGVLAPKMVSQRYVVETITMTTVTERRIVREATDTISTTTSTSNAKSVPAVAASNSTFDASKLDDAPTSVVPPIHPGIDRSAYLNTVSDAIPNVKQPPTAALSTAAQISGILKGGKLWKSDPSQSDDSTNITSDDESSKRSVRFTDNTKEPGIEQPDPNELHTSDRELCDGESQKELDEDDDTVSEPIEPTLPPKKHSSIFHNALRPNSAVRQLFPSTVQPPLPAAVLTHEALRAFEEAKRSHISAPVVHSDSESDTIRRTIERNALRRSLIKKKQQRTDNSLEERIRRLTCDVDDNLNNSESSDSNQDGFCMDTLERRDSPAGEENPQQPKYGMDKSFSPSSSASSSSSGSTSAYRKITDIFNRDRRQERIPEADENPIVIIPQMQECRCPAAPDLGMGIQMPAAHTQIHQTPPRQTEARRQFLSTLAPLTSCVAGQRDDLSYYTLAPGERASTASSQYSEYSVGDIEAVLKTNNDDTKKVAPDVIAGTPGQEYDELANFAQQESVRTERLKKRYSAEASASAPNSNAGSDDDEQNDYGFNKRPSVRGIKPRFSSTNEILQQMQAQLSTPTHPQSQVPAQATQQVAQVQSNTLPKNHSYMIQKSTAVSAQQPQQAQTLQHHHQHMHQQQQQQQQQQIAQASTVVNQTAIVNQTHQQQIAAWNYYHEQQQRNAAAGYYQTLPLQARHSFHGHEESTVYQNCQTVAMEQHYNRAYARSPTRRPESPPPLRNYHQTMVLIPYNTESYAHFSSNEQQVPGGQQFQRHNVLEYQQVTQQTIRVPMGYPMPGMQLHVVAGRNSTATAAATGAAGAQHYAQYAQHQNAARSFAYAVTDKPAGPNAGGKFTERGVPEGAASVPQSDTLMSPTSGGGAQAGANASAAPGGAVFYAMNV